MFWRLSFRQPSAIDTLLDKEDCTLGEILDEDDVLQECKTQNRKLVDFLVRSDILEALVKMVTLEPDNDVEDKVKFKYPHLACELLTSEVFAIVEKLTSENHYLNLLWAFLDSPHDLNPLIGSFISKVLAMLLNQKSQVVFDYISTKEDFVPLFLAHLGTSAMMDLLLQMVAATPDNDQCRFDLAEWLKEQGIVEKLIDFIHPSTDPEQCTNSSQALCDMIRLSREAAHVASPTPLLPTLESEETMQRLLDNLFCSEMPTDIVIVNAIAVLLTALERRPANPLSPGLNRPFNQPEEIQPLENSIAPGAEQLLTVVIPRIKDFHGLLTRKPSVPPMLTTVGLLSPPLGNMRLQVIRLYSALLQCNNALVAKEIARLKSFTVLVDLFFEFPWNNFLHSQVECCVSAAINSSVLLDSSGEEGEGNSQFDCPKSLRHHLIWDCELVRRLLRGADLNVTASSQPGGRRQGYMGHLIRIVNAVSSCMEGNDILEEAKKVLDEDTHQRWRDFVSGPIADMNRKNETNLGGNRPLHTSMDDSDEEFDQLGMGPDSELEKAYQQYQDVKYVGALIDDYNVEDELTPAEEPFGETFTRLMDISCLVAAEEDQSQAATAFETACRDRIQQFDDSESDDEDSSTWAHPEDSSVTPVDQRSTSSDEDEFERRPREFQTGSSDEEELLSKRAAAYLPKSLAKITAIEPQPSKDRELDTMEIDSAINVITWRSDLSSEEDLGGVVAMDTSVGASDWTKEPEPSAPQSPGSSWADFTQAFHDEGDSRSAQEVGMELEHSLEPSFIEVHVPSNGRGGEEGRESDDKLESPEKPDPSLYKPLSLDDSAEEVSGPKSPADMDSLAMASPDRGMAPDSDSDGQSSDSEEGNVSLNDSTRSDRETLLPCSPNRDADELTQEGSPAHPAPSLNGGTTSSSSTASQVCNPAEQDRHGDSGGGGEAERGEVRHNSRGPLDDASEGLEDNYSFLSHGLLSESTGNRTKAPEVNEVEQKRVEALEACAQYEREVQGLQNK